MTNILTNICCLCLNSQVTNLINIFDKKSVQYVNIASVIKKHFWFEIEKNYVNKYICAICWSKLDDFHSFYTQIYKLHIEYNSNVHEIIKVEIDDEYCSKSKLLDNSQLNVLEPKKNNKICDKNPIITYCIKIEAAELSDYYSADADQLDDPLDSNSDNCVANEVDNEKICKIMKSNKSIKIEAAEFSDNHSADADQLDDPLDNNSDNCVANEVDNEKICKIMKSNNSIKIEAAESSDKHSADADQLDDPLDNNSDNCVANEVDNEKICKIMKSNNSIKIEAVEFSDDHSTDVDQLDDPLNSNSDNFVCNEDDMEKNYKIIKTNKSVKIDAAEFSGDHSADADQLEDPLDNNSDNCVSRGDDIKKNCRIMKSNKTLRILNKKLKTIIEPIDKDTENDKNIQIQEYVSMECEICTLRCDTFKNIQIHYRTEHKMKGYIRCCNRKFTKRSTLSEHVDRHLNPNKFKCNVCNKIYATKHGLVKHRDQHLSFEEKPFKCTKCPKRFVRNILLEYHLATHNKKVFVCNVCGKLFSANKLLQAHIENIHSRTKIYICDACAREFRCKRTFEQHQLTVHQNIVLPKAQCQLCGIWLKHKDILRKHMIGHEESKSNHFCSICGKQFLNSKVLHKHVTTVHSDKVYTCNLCEKTFKKQISLKEHMASHTGAPLYSCTYCLKTFNSSANMYAHKKKMHVKEREEQELLKTTGFVVEIK